MYMDIKKMQIESASSRIVAEAVDHLAIINSMDNLYISNALGRSRSYVQARRSGQKDWDMTELDKLAKLFGLSNAFALIDYSRGILDNKGDMTRGATND